MIASLDGTVRERGIDHVVIEVGGVGLRVAISLQTLASVPEVGGRTRLVTYLQGTAEFVADYPSFVEGTENRPVRKQTNWCTPTTTSRW